MTPTMVEGTGESGNGAPASETDKNLCTHTHTHVFPLDFINDSIRNKKLMIFNYK